MTNPKILKKLNAKGVRLNADENRALFNSEQLFNVLSNSVKAYKYAFDIELNDEREAAQAFVLESKKKIRDHNGEKISRARIRFLIEEIKDFFNKFNLDGKGFVEDKLVFYLADLDDDTSVYFVISEELLDEIMEIEDERADQDSSEDDERNEDDEDDFDDEDGDPDRD